METCRTFCIYILLVLTLATTETTLQCGQSAVNVASLTIDDVLKLSHAGLAEDVIITKIRKNGKAFDLSTDELVELKRQGLSDDVIKYLLDPAQPYNPAAPPPSAAAATRDTPQQPGGPITGQYPDDTLAGTVPLEPGLYKFSGDAPARIEIKMLLGEKEGAGMGKMLMKKGKTIAYLVGNTSKTRLTAPQPVFYIRLPEGKGIEEIALVQLEQKSDRRQLEIGSGPKAESVRSFDPLAVGPHLFRITTSSLLPGEYLFLMVGSADPAKGSYGKGYDFTVQKK